MGINSNNWYDEMEESKKIPQESKETLEQKGLSLSVSDEGDIVMTVTGEDGKQKTVHLRRFLNLTPRESEEERRLIIGGFILVGVRMVQGDRSWYPEWFERFTKEYEDLFAPEKEFRFFPREQSGSSLSSSKDVRVDLVFARLNISKLIGMLRKDLQEEVERLGRGTMNEEIMLTIIHAHARKLNLIRTFEEIAQETERRVQEVTGMPLDWGTEDPREKIAKIEELGNFGYLKYLRTPPPESARTLRPSWEGFGDLIRKFDEESEKILKLSYAMLSKIGRK